MTTTVACVWVKGHVPFTATYVTRLHAMVTRWMDRPFRFVCLTDQPARLPDCIEALTVSPPPGCFAWWTKLQLFNRSLALYGRVLYLDLDTLIVGALGPIVDFEAPFALIPDPGSSFKPRNGLQVIKRYNSSVMTFDAGIAPELFERWTPAVADRLWGDQDWIGQQYLQAAAMPIAWFPRLSELTGPPLPKEARVILAKKPKNVEAAKRYPWFREAWG